ncbi:unnamed protein product [Lampetra planeri]
MPISIICSMPLPFEERAAESPAKGRDLERERRRQRQQQQRGGDGRFEREVDSPPAPSAPPAATSGGGRSLSDFAGGSTLHGVSHVFAPGERSGLTARRTLWALAVIASIALLLLQCVDRVAYYLRYPRITSLDETSNPNVIFPAVTICNFNTLRRSALTYNDLFWTAELLGLPEGVIEAEVAGADLDGERPSLGASLGLPGVSTADARRPGPGRTFNMLELYARAGHRMEDMLLQCRYRAVECKHVDFVTVYTRYGKCYTFNSGKGGRPLLTTVKGGMGNGLEIMLDIQQEEYLPVWGENDETSFEAGIKVQIHSQDEPPLIDQLGFGVSPGFQTFVSCQEQRLIYLPPPWGDCKSTPISSDFFETYSITACRIDCETRYLVENCNCRMVHMPGDAPYCTPEQYTECARPVLDVLVKRDNDFCLCETPCNMTRYGKELSMVKIPSKASAKYLAKKYNKTEAYIAENVLVLDIFFEALNYETIEQKKAYEVAGLLGDIGGQMGLFIGASILTILEIFDYVYEVSNAQSFMHVQPRLFPDDTQNAGPCEALRGHSESAGYAASMLPPPHHHHQHHALHHHAGGRPGYEDFTC